MAATAFTVAKYDRRWCVWQGDKPAQGTHYHATKRAALAQVTQLETRMAYECRVLEQDASGQIVFDADELEQIAKLAAALRDNTITKPWQRGDFRSDARYSHRQDAITIQSWVAQTEVSDHGKLICAEIRRRMAARELAFADAGVNLQLASDIASVQNEWKLCRDADDYCEDSFVCICDRAIDARDGHSRIEGRRCLDCSAKLDEFLIRQLTTA